MRKTAQGLSLLESMLAFVIFSIALIPILQVHHISRGEVQDAAILCRLLIKADGIIGSPGAHPWPLHVDTTQVSDALCKLVVHRPAVDPTATLAPLIEGDRR